MASFATDLVFDGLKDLVKSLTLKVAQASVIGVSRFPPEGNTRSPEAQKEIEAEIEAFFGDSLSKEMVDLKQFIEVQLQDATRMIVTSNLDQGIYLEINSNLHKIQVIQEAFYFYIENPELQERKDEYLRASEMLLPHHIITFFNAQIKQGQPGETLLLDRLIESCQPNNQAKFKSWQRKINFALVMALFHRAFLWGMRIYEKLGLADRYVTLFGEWKRRSELLADKVTETDVVKECTVNQLRLGTENKLVCSVVKELTDLDKKRTGIMGRLAGASLRLGCHFVFEKCSDRKHAHCGSSSDDTCCLLGTYVYGFLRDIAAENAQRDVRSLECRLRSSLTERWPAVVWSVFLSTTPVGYYIMTDLQAPWIHSQGIAGREYRMLQRKITATALPKSSNLTIGCMHRYRRKADCKLTDVVVVWVDPLQLTSRSETVQTFRNVSQLFRIAENDLLFVEMADQFSEAARREPSLRCRLEASLDEIVRKSLPTPE